MFAGSKYTRRNNKGASLIEVAVGAMFFIPIALFAIDLVSVSLVEQVNDHIACDAARAAANQLTQAEATAAAQKSINTYKVNALIASVHLDECSYNNGVVQLKTSIDARMPAPFLGFNGKRLIAQSFQPIVATPADL